VFRRRRKGGEHRIGSESAEADYAPDEEFDVEEFDDEELDDEELDDEDLGYSDDDPGAEADFDEDPAAGRGYSPAGEEVAGRAGRPQREDLGDPATWTRLRDSGGGSGAADFPAGPWDSASEFPDGERIDLGSVLVPVKEGFDVQAMVSEEGITVAVVHGDSGLQVQPFAAPRSGGLWDEIRPEIADEVMKAGGQSQEEDGPFGPELLALVTPQPPSDPPLPPQPLRFLGVDGPRWFLRGLISGPAATDRALAVPLEELFADIVVVRGDHAEPPRKALEIRLPEEARQALEEAAAQDPNMLNPFERGPEITETR
jgi:Protein of unknown function (DUF3710)